MSLEYGIEKGATEYVIVCSLCGSEKAHHAYTKKLAIEAFRECGWSVSRLRTVCPDCRENKSR